MTARAELPKGRKTEGKLIVTLDDGTNKTFRCLGRSDQKAANDVGNPSRDPLKRYGDLPVGGYQVTRSSPAQPTAANLRSYGVGPVWHLDPKSGQALAAKNNGRFAILIHGGAPAADGTSLRPTHGCLRVQESTVTALAKLDAQFHLTVVEV